MYKRVLLCLIVAVVACTKHETTTATTTPSAPTPAPTTTAQSLPAHNADNLLSLASGAMPVILAGAPEQGGEPYYMFDDDPNTGWSSPDGKFNMPTVVEMADRAVIKQLEFDEAKIAYDGRLPKKVLIEVSDTSATAGFKPIAEVSITEMKDGLTFPVQSEVPGRYVRLTVTEPASDAKIAQIMELRAFGDRLTHNPPPNVTGDYEMRDTTHMHLRQDGTAVTGCYEHASEPLEGGMEGRVLKFKYAVGENGSGPAVLVFSDDGHVFGGWWRTDNKEIEHPSLSPLEAKRVSTDPGKTACPQWSKPPAEEMAEELKKQKKLILYGINFDSDSDVIRPESKPTLDRVAAMLQSDPSLNVTIGGHTDNTSTPEHNQDLSTRRANAVTKYLVTAGIDAARMTATGYGSSQPVATNDTALGRAANRRVEMAQR